MATTIEGAEITATSGKAKQSSFRKAKQSIIRKAQHIMFPNAPLSFFQQAPESALLAARRSVLQERLNTPGFSKIPHCIYFIYISEKDPATHRNNILHYYDRGDGNAIDTEEKLEQRIASLIVNARNPSVSDQYPPPSGETWRRLVFERVSYLVFAFDFPMTTEPTFSIMDENRENHSFHDGRVIEVERCKVGVCVNHMKNGPEGDDLDRDTQLYFFELVTNPGIVWEGMVQHPDSGGTNQGPGAPPPD